MITGWMFVLVCWSQLSAGWIARGMVQAYKRRRRAGASVPQAVTGRKPDVRIPKLTEQA